MRVSAEEDHSLFLCSFFPSDSDRPHPHFGSCAVDSSHHFVGMITDAKQGSSQ